MGTPRGTSRLSDYKVSVEEVEAVAGRGLAGDRYFDRRLNHIGQLMLFDGAGNDQLRIHFDQPS